MVQRIVVVGGGVIGLACARRLAGEGRRVTVLDGSTSSKESSWAAAGILGAGSEHVADGPLFRLCRDAYRDAPATLRDLEAETGVSLGRRSEGTLVLARSAEEATSLGAKDDFLRRHGVESRWLDPAAARAQEPRLEGPILGAVWIREGRLDNRALWRAYEASCRARGVVLRAGEAVTRVTGGGRARRRGGDRGGRRARGRRRPRGRGLVGCARRDGRPAPPDGAGQGPDGAAPRARRLPPPRRQGVAQLRRPPPGRRDRRRHDRRDRRLRPRPRRGRAGEARPGHLRLGAGTRPPFPGWSRGAGSARASRTGCRRSAPSGDARGSSSPRATTATASSWPT